MFEKATKGKYRYNFKGSITTEDLFDLSVESLDSIYKGLIAEKKAQNEDSLLNVKSKESDALDTSIEIVKHIVSIKLAEAEARKSAATKRVKKARLMDLIAEKQDEALKNKSLDELMQLAQEL